LTLAERAAAARATSAALAARKWTEPDGANVIPEALASGSMRASADAPESSIPS